MHSPLQNMQYAFVYKKMKNSHICILQSNPKLVRVNQLLKKLLLNENQQFKDEIVRLTKI